MKLLILLLLFGHEVQAGAPNSASYAIRDWQTLRASALSEARTQDDAQKRLDELARLKASRELCESQLKYRRIPVSCFDLIAREERAGFIKPADRERARLQIADVCVSSVSRIRDLSDDQLRLEVPDTRCRSELEARRARLRYKNGLKDPLHGFDSRHRF